jgi:hypothetical protein
MVITVEIAMKGRKNDEMKTEDVGRIISEDE